MELIKTGKLYNFCPKCEPKGHSFLQPIKNDNEYLNCSIHGNIPISDAKVREYCIKKH